MTEPEYMPGKSVVVYGGLEPVAVRVEHPVRPGQAAFCRVCPGRDETGTLGMFRADDDDGNAIKAGVFVEAPKWARLLSEQTDTIAWMRPTTDADTSKP